MSDEPLSHIDLPPVLELQSLAEQAAGAGFWSVDLGSGRQYLSSGLRRLLVLGANDAPKGLVPWQSVLTPAEVEDTARLIRTSIETLTPFRATFRIALPDGGGRWLDVHGQASYGAAGQPLRFSGYCIDVTDRRQAEEEYREIKERQSFLLQLSDALAPLSDPVAMQVEACRVLGRYLKVNRVFYAEAEDSGLNRAGPQYVDGVPPTADVWNSDEYDPTITARYEAGVVLTCEDVAKMPNIDDRQRASYAKDRIVAWAAVPIAKQGLPTGRLVIHQARPRRWTQFEIDLIKETAERVWPAVQRAKSQAALELTENIPVGTYTMVLAPGHTVAAYSFLSKRFLEITGLKADDVRSDALRAFACIHPDDYQSWLGRHVDAWSKRVPVFGETRIVLAGETRWIRVESSTRNMPDGTTVWEGVLFDITDERRAEEALKQSESNFRHLFDDAPDAYVIFDLKTGLLLACNNAAERMLRASANQIVGMTPDQLSPEHQPDGRPSREGAEEHIRTSIEKGYHRFEWVHRRLDGTNTWVEVSVTVGTFQNRKVLYGIWREIGEIIAAKQAAEAASIAKSQFLSVMSHELRTPLTAITGMFQLIEMAGVSDKARDYVARGLKSSEHLLRLVEDILNFSSIEAGRLSLVPKPFRLGTLLEEVSDACAAQRNADVGFTIDVASSLKELDLLGDALRLKQVLINLLGNAFKFTDGGQVTLAVVSAGGTAEAPELEFSVADSGIGLTPAQKARLFLPFSQADMSDTRRFGGTGLGLAISQKLVTLLGGDAIAVESNPGAGSRFAFQLTLPLAGNTAQHPAAGGSHAEATSPGARLDGMRLLLVEDSETIRLAIRLLLESEGAIVEEAADGAEAVHQALGAGMPHDAVLMDMQLPIQDGVEAARELRRRGYAQPIIALTANAFARDVEACLNAGMNDYVAKPAKIGNLVAALLRGRGP